MASLILNPTGPWQKVRLEKFKKKKEEEIPVLWDKNEIRESIVLLFSGYYNALLVTDQYQSSQSSLNTSGLYYKGT